MRRKIPKRFTVLLFNPFDGENYLCHTWGRNVIEATGAALNEVQSEMAEDGIGFQYDEAPIFACEGHLEDLKHLWLDREAFNAQLAELKDTAA